MKFCWKTSRHALEWRLLSLLAWVIPRTPRWLVVKLARCLGGLAYWCDWRGRRLAQANIRAAFGQRYSANERAAIARAAYRDISRTMLDLLWSPALTHENYRQYLRIENIEVLHRLKARGESAIMLCIHHGNFEWASLAAGFEGFPIMIVAEESKNRGVGRIFQQCREVSGHRIIPQKASMLRLLKHVKKGGFAGMLVDLNCRPHEAATIIHTFGLAMCASYLHAVLAARGGARVVPVESRSQPDGTCRVIFHEPLDTAGLADAQSVAQWCWDFFEPAISEHPELWLWSYRHWRYTPSGETPLREYPFYARTNAAFDRLVARLAGNV